MQLSQTKRNKLKIELSSASRSAVHGVMARLLTHWKGGTWLSQANHYRNDSVQQISDHVKNSTAPHHEELADYIAASAIAHCFDGWSYLARSLESEMVGDPDTARHLAYYAELRAAMSILAGAGIGVFHNRHVAMCTPERCNVLTQNLGTHLFVWHALEMWAESQDGVDAILNAIQPGGCSLSDWLIQFSVGSTFVATDWLRQWGLDLSMMTDDREARNQASYRPTPFTTPGPRSINDTMETILAFWEVCDPGAGGGFPVLDRYLLRRGLNLVFQSFHGSGRPTARAENIYDRSLTGALNGLDLKDHSKDWWTEFLSFQNLSVAPNIVIDAGENDNPGHPNHSKQVLARATLLLRVATGCSRGLLEAAGWSEEEDLEFWRSSTAVQRRLWPEAHAKAPSIELWTDVSEASTSIEEWLEERKNGVAACHYTLWNEQAREASTLATAERAFLWGVGL